MTQPPNPTDIQTLQSELAKLKEEVERSSTESSKVVEAAKISAKATNSAGWKGLFAGLGAAIITAGSAYGIAVATDDGSSAQTGSQTSITRVIDCTDEVREALDIYRLNPEITAPYSDSDPAEQLCQLNVRIAQVRAIDAPPP